MQDQWRSSRVTISAGLRFDWLRESVKATEVPAGMLVPARSFPARTDVPNWKDLNPRFGIVWDPTGDAKTAIKFGINRYVQSNTTGLAQLFDQAAGAVNSTTRSWNDQTFPVGDPRRGNFLPDCDLVATTANGECGAMANPNFGTYVPVNSPDPDWITGWGKRTYNWQTSINIDREVMPNLVVNAGYFRTWYGNFQVTDNLRVTPADYSPYCVTVPVDDRLPLSGQQLCGLYDINPGAFGQVDNLITRNDAYGKQEEIYNGVDVNFQVRLLGKRHARRRLEHRERRAARHGGGRQRLGRHRHLLRDRLAAAAVQLQGRRAVSEPHEAQRLVHVPLRHPGGRRRPEQPGRELRRQPYLHARRDPAVARDGRCRAASRRSSSRSSTPLSVFGPRINQFDLRGTKIFRFGAHAASS